MKNLLATYYLNNIERNFKREHKSTDNYMWEDYLKEFQKNTGYTFEELKHCSVIKAKYIYELDMKKNDIMIAKNYHKFEVKRAEYYDSEGNLNENKWRKLIEETNSDIEEQEKVDAITSFKNKYDGSEYEITGEFNEDLTSLFSELITYQTVIQLFEDTKLKKITIFILDYNPDCLSEVDTLYRFGGKLFTTSKRYWPKEKYGEMEEAVKYFKDRNTENTTYYLDEIDRFPYAVGTEKWVKHYFMKLPTEELNKYKQYDFHINFLVFSPITGFGGEYELNHLVKGKINWD